MASGYIFVKIFHGPLLSNVAPLTQELDPCSLND